MYRYKFLRCHVDENLALSPLCCLFLKEVKLKLAGVFLLPLTPGLQVTTNILENKHFFHYFFLQRRTPDELDNFKNMNFSL